MNDYRHQISRNVRHARKIKRMSQVDIAKAAGIDRSWLSGIENGKIAVNLDKLHAVASALEMTLASLLGHQEPWISTKDRLPHINSALLVWQRGYDRHSLPAIALFDEDESGSYHWYRMGSGDGALAVSHWMQLPEKPKINDGIERG